MKKKKPVVVAVSGGFDPVHVGHIEMFKLARKLGDRLVVILNNDNWLVDKKGFAFMDEAERIRILSAIKEVDDIFVTCHKKGDPDRSICKALEELKPDIFANGGDRKSTKDIPETATCKKLGIKMIFGLGDKVQSSSWLTKKLSTQVVQKPWGYMQTYRSEKNWWLKTLTVCPGQRLSLQSHKKRGEIWVVVEGKAQVQLGDKIVRAAPFQIISIKKHQKHRISNRGKSDVTLVEVACGPASEDDIVRYEDDYGRLN